MKGILEYSILSGGPWLIYGDVRPHLGKSYQVQSIPGANRVGANEAVGYSAVVTARAITLPDNFFNADKYFWRIDYGEIGLNLPLGEHPYIFSFDGLHERNKIFHYDITINFNVTNANLENVIIVLNTIP